MTSKTIVKLTNLLRTSSPQSSSLSWAGSSSSAIFEDVAGTLVSYDAGYALQSSLHSDVQASLPPSLIMLEHSPVFTLGRRADTNNFKFEAGDETSRVLKRGAAISSPSLIGVGNSSSKYHEHYLSRSCPPDILKHPTNSADLIRTTRGGDITYHGPGQLTAYPILPLSLEPFKKDLHWYLSKIEDVGEIVDIHRPSNRSARR